jgi:cell division septation protein DedD
MGAPELVKRLWEGLWNRQGLGRIVIKFYPRGSGASITVSPTLAALSRRYWHWLYLEHLAESLAAIGETVERVRLLMAARAMAEDLASRSVIGEKISDAGDGAADIVPEQAGGVALTAQVVQRDDGMPTIHLTWSPPQARDRIASSNLVLLVHVMKGAAHPLEQYEIFKKMTAFAEYCERAGCPRGRATLKAGPLYAVVHADLTEVASPGALVRHKVAVSGLSAGEDARGRSDVGADRSLSRDRPAARPLRDRRASPDPFWKRSSAAIGAAAVLWAGLVPGGFFLPRFGSPLPAPQPIASVPAAVRPQDAFPPPGSAEVRPQTQIPLPAVPRPVPLVKGRPGAAAVVQRPRPSLEREGGDLPKFRVVSGTLSLVVAENRSRILAEQGVVAFVQQRAGKLGRLQYGAYRSREMAEEDARHIRAQGYTAVVIPYY